MKTRIPAGKTIRKTIAVPHPEAAKEGFALRLSSDSRDVFTRDYVIQKRRIFSAGTKGGTPFDLKLAGFPAVDASIAVLPRAIALRFAIDDTKITPCLERPWEGSGVELFFIGLQGRGIRQIFVVPEANGRKVHVLDMQQKAIPSVRTRIGAPFRKAGGYELNIEVPFAAAELAPDETTFLFDAIVHLTALGDAHGGGRTSLSGRFDSHVNSDYFVQVEGA